MVTFNTVERKQHRLADGLGEDTIGGPSHSGVGVRSGKTMGLVWAHPGFPRGGLSCPCVRSVRTLLLPSDVALLLARNVGR